MPHCPSFCYFFFLNVSTFLVSQVSGYGEKTKSLQKGAALSGGGESDEERSTLSGFRALVGLLLSLTNNDGDGRIIISRAKLTCNGQLEGYLKYVMLTGEKIFHEVGQYLHILRACLIKKVGK